jgi:hypothetical protein
MDREDCGGIPGFYDLIEALSDPNHERHEEILDWIGEFDPQSFSVERVNRCSPSASSSGRHLPWLGSGPVNKYL